MMHRKAAKDACDHTGNCHHGNGVLPKAGPSQEGSCCASGTASQGGGRGYSAPVMVQSYYPRRKAGITGRS